MKRTGFWALGLALVVVLAACGSQTLPDLADGRTPTARDGRLIFANIDAFGAFMEEVVNQEATYLDALEESLAFTSRRRHVNRLASQAGLEDERTQTVEEIVEDPYLATVLNTQGEVQVGDKIYKVTQGFVYAVNAEHAALLAGVEGLSAQADAIPGVEVFRIERATEQPSAELSTLASDTCTRSYKSEHRMKSESWITNWGFYASAGAETVSEKRKGFWPFKYWGKTKAERLSLWATYNLFVNGVPTADVYSEVKTNAEQIKRTFAYTYAIGFSVNITGTVRSFHEINNPNYASCSTNISKS